MNLLKPLALAAVIAAIATAAPAEMFKWQDADGIWHYSDTKPPDDVETFESMSERPTARAPRQGGVPEDPVLEARCKSFTQPVNATEEELRELYRQRLECADYYGQRQAYLKEKIRKRRIETEEKIKEIGAKAHAEAAIPRIPQHILVEIMSMAADEHPGDHRTQEYVVREQAQAYIRVRDYVNTYTPADVLVRIKRDAARDHYGDYRTQEYVIEREVAAHARLRALKKR